MESIKIFPYCTPDEEFENEWLEGYHGFNAEEQDNEFDFFDRIDTAVEACFLKALSEMKPLLKDVHLNEIQLVSDYTGIFLGNGPDASWWVRRSKPEKGNYTLLASPSMINACLHLSENPALKMSSRFTCAWQHELIRIADQQAILTAEKWSQFGSDKMIRRKYLTEYREEGIAELYCAAKGYCTIHDLDEARAVFMKDIERITVIDQSTCRKRKEYGKQVIRTASIFEAGPFMILHALSAGNNQELAAHVQVVAEKLANKETLTNEEIFPVISAAVQLDPATFIQLLEQPGYDGKPFADLSLLNTSIQYNNTEEHVHLSSAS